MVNSELSDQADSLVDYATQNELGEGTLALMPSLFPENLPMEFRRASDDYCSIEFEAGSREFVDAVRDSLAVKAIREVGQVEGKEDSQ